MAEQQDNEVYGLYASDIKKLGDGLNRLNKMSIGGGTFAGAGPVNYEGGFWAKITGQGTSQKWKYSWERQLFSDVDAGQPCLLTAYQSGRGPAIPGAKAAHNNSDEHYAVEAIRRSEYVPKGSLVWMSKPLYQPYYVFEYEGRCRYGYTLPDGIPATSGSTLGKAAVQFRKRIVDNIDTDTEAGQIQCYNLSSQAVKGDTFVIMQMVEGAWVVVVEDCA